VTGTALAFIIAATAYLNGQGKIITCLIGLLLGPRFLYGRWLV
jgi:hypothetical protein